MVMEQEQYEIVKSIKCVREYCKEHGVFAYNDYMERSFNRSLDEVLKVNVKPIIVNSKFFETIIDKQKQ